MHAGTLVVPKHNYTSDKKVVTSEYASATIVCISHIHACDLQSILGNVYSALFLSHEYSTRQKELA